jgi:RNA polymerase sigma factor (sigma-70 family)
MCHTEGMHSGLTDTEIIEKVLAGDKLAYAKLLERYQSYVFTLVLRMVKSREDAEEVSQDVFVKAFRCLADFRGDSKFSTWLYTIVYTVSITFLRKKKIPTMSLETEMVFSQTSNQQSNLNANRVETKSRHKMVNEALNMLSPDDAQIITLFYKAEQSLDEMGRILSLEPNTVKVKLHRARLKLKEKMEKHFSPELRELFSY